MIEEWKDIENYEGLYQISNLGRVKSLNYNHTGKERLLKPGNNRCGYLYVNLWKNGKVKKMTVHRLVAQAFLENPTNLPEVNHIDENKENNKVENLEWCDRKYNMNHGTRNERVSKSMIGKLINRKDQSIQIDQFTKSGIYVKTWLSSMDAQRNGYTQPSIIACCKGKLKSHAGYIWKYRK